MNSRLATLAAAAALLAGPAGAGVIFDDGPTNGTSDGLYIDGPGAGPFTQTIDDTFTATGSGTVGKLQAGIWVPTGETPTSLTWWLGTSALSNSLGGGTVALSAGNYAFLDTITTTGGTWDVYEVTLTGLTSSALTAGDQYVLTLGGGNDSGGDQLVGWDVNNGPAVCNFGVGGTEFGACGFGGEAFTLSTAGTPEPAAWALMLAGFARLGAMLRRRTAQTV